MDDKVASEEYVHVGGDICVGKVLYKRVESEGDSVDIGRLGNGAVEPEWPLDWGGPAAPAPSFLNWRAWRWRHFHS